MANDFFGDMFKVNTKRKDADIFGPLFKSKPVNVFQPIVWGAKGTKKNIETTGKAIKKTASYIKKKKAKKAKKRPRDEKGRFVKIEIQKAKPNQRGVK